jgi:hypothetical protein
VVPVEYTNLCTMAPAAPHTGFSSIANRPVQAPLADDHEDLLFTHLKRFNDRLFEWLLWCKPERPDHGLSLNNTAQPLAEAMPTQCKMARPYEIFDLTDDPKPKLG